MDSGIKKIEYNNVVYSTIFDLGSIEEGLDFITDDKSFIQVGTWSYKAGKILDAHYHNEFERKSLRTQEVVLVLEGLITCNLFTEKGEFISSHKIEKNHLIIQYQGIHEYQIDKDSKILEIKNGPYFGPEKDRTRVNVRKN